MAYAVSVEFENNSLGRARYGELRRFVLDTEGFSDDDEIGIEYDSNMDIIGLKQHI